MHTVLQKFSDFYRELDQQPLSQLADIYSDDVEFCDPVHCVQGLAALTGYFEHSMQGVTTCRFDIHAVDELNGEAYVRWTMHFSHPRLNRGAAIAVPGVSHLRLAERITWHRDYFDLGAMLYEQLPLLGGLIRLLKSRLS